MNALKMQARLRRLLLLTFLLSFSVAAPAQFGTGTLNGTVVDSNDAVIPTAHLTLTNVDTNATRQFNTDGRGHYSIPDLPIGKYRLQTQATGFGTSTKEGIEMTVGAQLTVEIPLAPGTVSTTVTVSTDVQNEVNSTSGQQSTLIDTKQISDLPLNGRNLEQLILLAPGVQPAEGATRSALYGRAPSYSISGTRPEGQIVLLDGANIEGFWNRGAGASIIGTSLGIEAIAEFQTLTGVYGAQFGGDGSVINAVTKSGTNHIHGSAFDYLRNSVFDSRNYFDPLSGPPSFRRNQFGGSVGLPIRKDKTFFFINYEGVRQQLGEVVVFNVPDQNAHNGDLPCAISPGTPCGTNGLAHVGVNSAIAPLLNLLPIPNGALTAGAGTGRYTSVGNNPANEDYVNARLDEILSEKDNLAVRYVSDNGALIEPFPTASLGGFPEVDVARNRFVTIEEKHVFSPKLLNTARIHFTRTGFAGRSRAQDPLYAPFEFVPGAGYGSYIISSLFPAGAPNFGIGPNFSTPYRFIQNKFALQDDVYRSFGAHQLQIGIDVTKVATLASNPGFFAGQYTFPGLINFLKAAPAIVAVALPGSDAERNAREVDVSPYIQDDWKVNSHLSLNLGLRYEFVTNPTEAKNKFHQIINIATDPQFSPVSNVYQSNPSLYNIDPRFGFSYLPFGPGTAIRGGFGIFHDPIAARTYIVPENIAPPNFTYAILNPPFPNPLSGRLGAPSLQNGQYYYNNRTPSQTQFSLGIQQKLALDTVLTMSYVGNEGRHLFYVSDANPPISQVCPCTDPVNAQAATLAAGTRYFPSPVPRKGYARVNPAFAFLNYAKSGGTSHYNSLQTSLVRSLSHGLQYQINYTWSKAMDYSTVANAIEETNGTDGLQNPLDIRSDYGPSAFDIRNVGTANVLYAFPSRRNNKFLSGWEATLLAQIHSGPNYNVIEAFDRANLNDSVDLERPNQVADPNIGGPVAANPGCVAPATVHTVSNWYNPCAFVLQPVGTIGNERRNSLIAPAFQNFDFGVIKETTFRENLQAQFRAELFNVLNHTNLAYPNFAVFTATGINTSAGSFLNTVGTSRQVQFSLKLLF